MLVNRLNVVIRNTAVQVIGKIITALSTLLIARLVAEKLGLDGFGQYSIILAYSAYFYILTDFGINAIATKKITEEEDRLPYYFSNLLSLRLVMAGVLVFLALALLAFLPYSNLIKLGIIASVLTIVCQAIFVNSNAIFQAKIRFDQSILSTISAGLTTLLLSYLSLQAGLGVFGLVLSLLVGYLMMAALSLVFAHTYTPLSLSFDTAMWRKTLISAFPLSLTIILNLVYFRADMFILSMIPLNPSLEVTNEQATGLYSMAYKIFENAIVIPVFFVNVLYPLMIKAYQKSLEDLVSLVKKSLLGLLAVSVVISAVLYLASPLLISIVSGNNPEFAPSVKVLRILSLFLPFFFVTNTLLWSIMTLGKQKVLALFYGMAALVNIGLNIWLIPSYGYLAAAITTGVTEAVTLVFLGSTVWRYLKNKKAA